MARLFFNSVRPNQECPESVKEALLEHQYDYIKPIGKGGFSTVHLVHSKRYNTDFVCKVESGTAKQTNETELRTLLNLAHPNIISLYEYFYDKTNSLLLIILEYCPGGSLDDLLKDLRKKNLINNTQLLIPRETLYEYCSQVVKALKYCHSRGVAHRDIKPANLLLDKNGRIKLADFGLASKLDPNDKNGKVLRVGSKPYLSPEIINGSNFDPFKSDIWALGVTFYELASGKLPWNFDTEKDIITSISLGIDNFRECKCSKELITAMRSMLCYCESKRCSIFDLSTLPIFDDHKPTCNLPKIKIAGSNSISSGMWKNVKRNNPARKLLSSNSASDVEDSIENVSNPNLLSSTKTFLLKRQKPTFKIPRVASITLANVLSTINE